MFTPSYQALPSPLYFDNGDVDVDTQSYAAFAQVVWTPQVLDELLSLTVGTRYSNDQKQGVRRLSGGVKDNSEFDVSSSSVDPVLSVAYRWNEHLNTYLKYETAYRGPGANTRSSTFVQYDAENLQTMEFGLKSDFWEQRARVNMAVFSTQYKNKQIDFSDPNNVAVSETINGRNDIEIQGFELDVELVPFDGLHINLQYAYLDVDFPAQLNPLNNQLTEYVAAMAPKHAGSASLRYAFAKTPIGRPDLSVTYIASDDFYFSSGNRFRSDGYDLVNVRFNLLDIPTGRSSVGMSFALWVDNVFDQQWLVHSIVTSNVGVSQAFAAPRTFGLDVKLHFGE